MNLTKLWNTIPREAQECILKDANEQLKSQYKLPNLAQRYRGISTISEDDLEKIFSIETLFLHNYKELSDISFVTAFQKLVVLYIFGTQVTDLTPVASLPELYTLDMGHTNIQSFEPLSNSNLNVLMASYSIASDFHNLSKIQSLKKIDLSNNVHLTTLEPFQNLNNLEGIFFGRTQVSSLRPLINLTNLKEVWCLDAPISDEEIRFFDTHNKSGIKAKYWV